MMIRTLLLSSLVTVSFAACGKSSSSSGTSGEAAKATEGAAPVAKASPKVWKKIDKLGIEVEVGNDADIQVNADMPDTPSATIYSMDGSAPTTFIFGAKNPEEAITMSKDFDTTKERMKKEMNGFKSFTKEDKTADGYLLEYTGTDMGDATKPLFGYTLRTKMGELTLECSTNTDTEASRAASEALCKTIRAAK